MSRLVLALLAGTLFIAQAAAAEQSKGEPGHYQVIPGAAVPDKAGKFSEKVILLDTTTGQTWVLSFGREFGGPPGPIWEPLQVKPSKPVEAAAKATTKTKNTNSQKASTAPKPARRQPGPFDRYEYDDNP